MTELIQLVRRHEETAKSPDGKKLNRPTEEGLMRAYGRGIILRAQFPEHLICGRYSREGRTYCAVAAWMLGAGSIPVDEHLRLEHALNPIDLPHEQRQVIRNIADADERLRRFYDDLNELTTEVATRVARYLIRNIQGAIENPPEQPTVHVNITHEPGIAAHLVLCGERISYDHVKREEQMFDEGHGFDVQYRRDGHLYVVELRVGEKLDIFELDELVERVI